MCYVPCKICSQVKPPMIFCKPEQYEWHINNIVITIISTILTTFYFLANYHLGQKSLR